MPELCSDAAARLTGLTLAAAAWSIHLAIYPGALAYAYYVRGSWPSCVEALEIGAACFPAPLEAVAA